MEPVVHPANNENLPDWMCISKSIVKMCGNGCEVVPLEEKKNRRKRAKLITLFELARREKLNYPGVRKEVYYARLIPTQPGRFPLYDDAEVMAALQDYIKRHKAKMRKLRKEMVKA